MAVFGKLISMMDMAYLPVRGVARGQGLDVGDEGLIEV